jgi:dipeptidyl aminopeptidase/acylaminoacyl peptidase
MLKKIVIITIIVLISGAIFYRDLFIRLYQAYQAEQISYERAKYYQLESNLQIQDITQKLIAETFIPLHLKKPLIDNERRIVIFKYQSGAEYVGGYFSYLTTGLNPTIIFLRGGNEYFGIMRPNNQFSFIKGYNVVGTLYRGNIYGGVDQFGGDDIDDIENLIRFFPQLEDFTQVKLKAPYAMVGVSRGAMEMFIALSRLEYLKDKVSHAISISGNVDLNVSILKRFEVLYGLKNKFKKCQESNFENWLKQRNPICNVENLPKSLKVLLIYGLLDNRVFLEEQQNLHSALEKNGIASTLEILPEGNHNMHGLFKEVEDNIIRFLSSSKD